MRAEKATRSPASGRISPSRFSWDAEVKPNRIAIAVPEQRRTPSRTHVRRLAKPAAALSSRPFSP